MQAHPFPWRKCPRRAFALEGQSWLHTTLIPRNERQRRQGERFIPEAGGERGEEGEARGGDSTSLTN